MKFIKSFTYSLVAGAGLSLAGPVVHAADINGTNGNDLLFFQGNIQPLVTTLTNPFSGASVPVNGIFNVNTVSYDGLAGIDNLLFTNQGDTIFLEDPPGLQSIFNIEVFILGAGGDIVHLANTTFSLGDTTIDGGGSDDILWANVGDDTLRGLAGNDILDGGPGMDDLDGGADGDLLDGGDDNDTLDGGTGPDLLRGNADDDTLEYAVDLILPSGSNGSEDIFEGGSGFDTLVLTNGEDTLFLDDTVRARHPDAGPSDPRVSEIERITAGSGHDLIDFNSAVHSVSGVLTIDFGNGNDTAELSAATVAAGSNLTINGESGNETFDFSGAFVDVGASIVIQGGTGTGDFDFSSAILASNASLAVIGGNNVDTLDLSAADLASGAYVTATMGDLGSQDVVDVSGIVLGPGATVEVDMGAGADLVIANSSNPFGATVKFDSGNIATPPGSGGDELDINLPIADILLVVSADPAYEIDVYNRVMGNKLFQERGFGALNAADGVIDLTLPLQPLLACDGFMPPFDQSIAIGKKTKRAIPVKLALIDEQGFPITDFDIDEPPVINVLFGGTVYGESPPDDADLLPLGSANDDNVFRFDPLTEEWIYNLSTKQFTQPGIYHVDVVSGDGTEYLIEDNGTCEQNFVRQQ